MTVGETRRGSAWTAEEVSELIDRVRGDAAPEELAVAHGRSEGAIHIALWRLLETTRRPVSKNSAWQMLRQELAEGTEKVDWWARYTQGRKKLRDSPKPRKHKPAPPPVESFPETALDTEPQGHTTTPAPSDVLDPDNPYDLELELGPLVAEAALEIVSPRERFVLLRRLGMSEGPDKLDAIGEQLGITRERVRQLQNKALQSAQTNARHPGSAGSALSRAFTKLHTDCPPDERSLAIRLLAATDGMFGCDPIWLVMASSRMAGYSSSQAGDLAALASEYRDTYRQQQRENARAQIEQANCDRLVGKWVRAAHWPTNPTTTAAVSLQQRQRTPTTTGISLVGSFQSTKTGTIVYFESGLEEKILTTAEKSRRVRTYQEQPCTIDYTGLDGMRHTYYPDLVISLADGRTLLIEIKPLWQMALSINRIKCAAGQHFAAKHGWGWVSVADRAFTYNDLIERTLEPATTTVLDQALAEGPISWARLQQLRTQARLTTMDVAAYVAQRDIGMAMAPYRIWAS